MSYPINYPTPQSANVQIFKEGGSTSDWVKPQGASFVWFTLIGAGGGGNGSSGGGSGAVTNFMGPAFLMPDVLRVIVGRGGVTVTTVQYQQKDTVGYTLLQASSGNGILGGADNAAQPFAAMGFYQSIAGQSGTSSNVSPDGGTFLSAGTAAFQTVTGQYGYSQYDSNGFFQTQPIIVGVGAASNSASAVSGIGCGGGTNSARGGDGMVVIITW